MKIVGYAFAFILALLGFLLVSLSSLLNERSTTPHDAMVLGVIFIIWGYSLMQYISTHYQGGAASVIGVIILGFGVYITTSEYPFEKWTLSTETAASFILITSTVIGGLFLLYQGHQIHKIKQQYNKSINADTKPHA